MAGDIIKLNLRGVLFRTKSTKFNLFPDSRLANLSFSDEEYDLETNEYFFDRNPLLFHYILDAYDDGNVHLPKSVCSNMIDRELQFWKIGKSRIEKCCLNTFYADEGHIQKYEELEELYRIHGGYDIYTENCTSDNRRKIWRIDS